MYHSHIRPLSFGEVLDGAFSLYRANFLTFFLIALIPLLPVALAWGVLGFMVPSGEAGLMVLDLAQLFLAPYSLVATALVWSSLMLAGAAAYRGEEARPLGVTYRTGLSRLPTVLGAIILASLGIAIGLFLLVIPGIIFAIMCFAVVPLVVLEGRGAFEAVGRSRFLAKGAWGRIFGVMFLLSLITSIPLMVVGFAGVLGITGMGEAGLVAGPAFGLVQLGSIVGTALTTPLFGAGLLLQYYDRRVRVEGFDIELAAERLSVAS